MSNFCAEIQPHTTHTRALTFTSQLLFILCHGSFVDTWTALLSAIWHLQTSISRGLGPGSPSPTPQCLLVGPRGEAVHAEMGRRVKSGTSCSFQGTVGEGGAEGIGSPVRYWSSDNPGVRALSNVIARQRDIAGRVKVFVNVPCSAFCDTSKSIPRVTAPLWRDCAELTPNGALIFEPVVWFNWPDARANGWMDEEKFSKLWQQQKHPHGSVVRGRDCRRQFHNSTLFSFIFHLATLFGIALGQRTGWPYKHGMKDLLKSYIPKSHNDTTLPRHSRSTDYVTVRLDETPALRTDTKSVNLS